MADNYIIKKINELQELASVEGSEYLAVYQPASGKTKKIKTSLIEGGEDTALEWDQNATYSEGDIIEWNLKLWKSKVDNNTGNTPAENEYWTEVSKSGANGFGNYETGVYSTNPSMVVYEKNLYLLDTDEVTMPFESTDFPAELTAGKWLQLTGTTETILDNAAHDNLGTTDPTALNSVLSAINEKAGDWNNAYTKRYWQRELVSADTTEHPRWDDSGDSEIYGRDKFGFNALPSGQRDGDEGMNDYQNIGVTGRLWSAMSSGTYNSYAYDLMDNRSEGILDDIYGNYIGLSIRLVRSYVSGDGDKIDGRILENAYTDPDGNNYNGVIIGDQVWMTENLKTTKYSDGTDIPTGYNDTDWSNLTTGAYAVYDYTLVSDIDSEAEMIEFYGLLYNWYAVDNAAGLGDTDWHVPTDAEFTTLTDYIETNYSEIDSTNSGDYLKSVRQVNSPFEVDSDTHLRPVFNIQGDRYKIRLEDIQFQIREEDSAFTISSADGNFQIAYTGATDITVTVPNSLIKGIPITITQVGAGVVTLEGNTGVTVNGLGLKTPGQGGHIQLWKRKDNVIDTAGGVQ